MKKLLAVLFALAVGFPAFGQDIPNHAVPIGGGQGVVGWKSVGPCTASQLMYWNSGVGADPACSGTLPSGLTGYALTANNDTNVTLTLGGSASTALVNAASITAGWTGTLANSRLANMANGTLKCRSSSGTGSPEDCNYPILNVKDPRFGATGNGSTDDTTAIQAAITAAAATPSIVYIPCGTYQISSALTINFNYGAIIGENRLCTVLRATSSASVSLISSTGQYTRLEHLTITGPASSVQTAGTAINFNSSHGCIARDLLVANIFNGVSFDSSTNCLAQSIKMYDIYGAFGLQSANGGGDYIVNNQIDPIFYGTSYSFSSGFNAWATSTGYSIGNVVTNGGGNFVTTTNCTSSGTPGGPVATVFGTGITDGTCTWYYLGKTTLVLLNIVAANSNFVAFNDFSGPSGAGIKILGASSNNILDSNTIGETIGSGLALGTGTPTFTLIRNNVIENSYGQFSNCIQDSNALATGTTVIGNQINNCGWHGILAQSDNWSINDNLVRGACQITGTCGSINAGTNISNFTINGNMLSGAGGASLSYSIRVESGSSDHYQITGNNVGSNAILDSGTGTNKIVQANDGDMKYKGLSYVGGAPTAATCAGFAATAGSTDFAGRITYTSATTCSINFNTSFAAAPFCVVSPGSAASTHFITTSTTQLAVTFGTAQTAFFYNCFGAR